MTQSERRLSPRRSLRSPVRARFTTGLSPESFVGETVNVSEHGVCFITEQKMEVGTTFDLSITPVQSTSTRTPREIQCRGKVIHANPNYGSKGQMLIGAQILTADPPLNLLWSA